MSNYVFLIDQNKTPVMPIHPAKAREFLDKGKAAVFRRFPFTLILKRTVQDAFVYPLTLKIDPGSKVTGFALVTDRGEVVWRMQLHHNGSIIKKRLEQRRGSRRLRRSRLRYRKPRFNNRKRSKGWLPPSLQHRVLTTETWVKRIVKFCPVGEIWIERVKFDMQLMQNAEISGVEYQQGTLAGYTIREYLLEKFKRVCVYCGKGDRPLQIEHIHPRSKGGSDRVSNLTIACEKCNQSKGDKLISDWVKRKKRGQAIADRVLRQTKAPLKDAAAVNATRNKIVVTMAAHRPVETATGAQTKMNRIKLGLPKDHDIDAACVGNTPSLEFLSDRAIHVYCKGQGGRQRCQTDEYGYPQKHRPLRPIHGYQSGDIAEIFIEPSKRRKHSGSYVGKLYPYTGNRGELILSSGERVSLNQSQIVRVVHRKDCYAYT